MRWLSIAGTALFVLAMTNSAFAHPGHGTHENGVVAGLLHPLLGLDHLLAMVTVGLLSAQFGGRAVWGLPGSFVAWMLVGGILGTLGWELPGVEIGIATSIMLLGLAVALDCRRPLGVALALTGMFGFLHGHAHGTEMPTTTSMVMYAAGFVVATAALHITGVLLGRWSLSSVNGKRGLRVSGGAIAAAGLWFASLS
ncbi:MAG: HupE/UreJ family protein [Planctomycetaceae bacterium]|nr:HupE/UreJ family protein [Planctomycetaceae bacterium]